MNDFPLKCVYDDLFTEAFLACRSSFQICDQTPPTAPTKHIFLLSREVGTPCVVCARNAKVPEQAYQKQVRCFIKTRGGESKPS